MASLQEEEEEFLQVIQESTQFSQITFEQLQKALKNGILAEVIDRLQNGWLKSDSKDKELLPYFHRQENMTVLDNVLVSDDRVVIPQSFRSAVLKKLHLAHPGIRRMMQLARRYFYWPAMHNDIENFVKNCYHCSQVLAAPLKEPLHPWPDSCKPWTRIHIDFAGPLQKQWILVIVDSYSKFVEAACFSSITAAATCRYLRRFFSRYGPPEVLVSDNGTQFTSEEFAQLCSEFNILHLRSPPGHPQSNGQAERMVGSIKRSLDLSSSSLEDELNRFVYTYNYTPCDAAPEQKSPAEIFFGRTLRTPLDLPKPLSVSQ